MLLPDINDLSLEQQVAQMIVVRASGYLFDHQIRYPAWEPPSATLQYWLQDLGIGGVILLGGSAGELALKTQQLQNWAKIPLLIAADVEEGVGQRFAGATWLAPPMAIGAIASKNLMQAVHHAEQMGAIIAQESLAIGINWILAPVVDVNNNPQNPVINVRAFGETPEIVNHLASAFIRGTEPYPVLTTAKHFPGHGDTATDSHLDLPLIRHAPPRLATVELPPFKAAITAGVDAIMSAHILVPAWDEQHPATLSYPILTELLRNDLQFTGLVVTDALIMGAIANRYGFDEAPIMAIQAGADILLMPVNPESAIQAVCEAVAAGHISQERIRASVERIWKAKGKAVSQFGKQDTNPTKTQNNLLQLAQPTSLSTTGNILRESQVLGGDLPLFLDPDHCTQRRRNLIIVDDALDCEFLGRHTPSVAIPRQIGYELQLVDRHTPQQPSSGDHLIAEPPTLLQLFIRGNPFRGSAGLMPVAEDWFKRLLQANALQALVIYGSPYVLGQFLPDLPPHTPYVFSFGQMHQAQAIALDSLFAQSVSFEMSSHFL